MMWQELVNALLALPYAFNVHLIQSAHFVIRIIIIDSLLIRAANAQQDTMMLLHRPIIPANCVLVAAQPVFQVHNAVLVISTINVPTA